MHQVICIGAGVAGICQVKHLTDRGTDVLALEANEDLGGTWFRNRYPGCRFDSESYTYGYKFSRELLDEWDWTEHFSPQPENLRYLNFVADKFDLRQYFRFNSKVQSLDWSEAKRIWTVTLTTGEIFTSRFIVSCLGALSLPFTPDIAGLENFSGQAFHSYDWPSEPLSLEGKKVAVIGTGATGIQIIGEIADKVGQLSVFQRHPNWSVPLQNSKISTQEMAEIRARYDEIFAMCEQSQGGFCHLPNRKEYQFTTPEERRAFWDELYNARGFSLLLSNYRETFLEAQANRDLSDYVAERIRERVSDPALADKLIPKDHGFGMRRLPLETNYFEAYNHDHVELVDLTETPITQINESGIETAADGKTIHREFDIIVLATGFETMTGSLNQIDIRGTGDQLLREKWRDDSPTYLGVMTCGFPNMLMVAGPQSVSGSTNYPQAIETGAEWITALLDHAFAEGVTRIEPSAEGEDFWQREVTQMQAHMPFSKVKSWFTGYNPNAAEGASGFRHNAYWGGVPKYKAFLSEAANGYPEIIMQ